MSSSKLRVCAAHLSSKWMDPSGCVDKAVDAIAEAARSGAQLVAFSECFVSGFPVWAALAAPILTHDYFKSFAASAVRLDGPEVDRLREAARRHAIHVSIGFTEGTEVSVGCLWNSNIIIGPDGRILNHRRKLVPTYYEKLSFAPGDAAGLRVVETSLGRLGMLICGENTNPLARYALMAQGEQLHIATFPPLWPTRVPGEAGAYDLEAAILVRCGAHAFEAKCFVLVAAGCFDRQTIDRLAGLSPEAAKTVHETPGAVSLLIGPDGRKASDVQRDEGLLFADVDLEACVEPKQFHDVVGYYNRFDIFRLEVDRTPCAPAYFKDFDEPAGDAGAD